MFPLLMTFFIVPKATDEQLLVDNLKSVSFDLTADDMEALSNLNCDLRVSFSFRSLGPLLFLLDDVADE
jgi:diketogulonate reductase-like aldo/keto reductase